MSIGKIIFLTKNSGELSVSLLFEFKFWSMWYKVCWLMKSLLRIWRPYVTATVSLGRDSALQNLLIASNFDVLQT